LAAELDHLTGDGPSLAREAEFLKFQIEEIERVQPVLGEDRALETEEALLAGAVQHREAGGAATDLLGGDAGARDQLARAIGALRDREPFSASVERLVALELELDDCVRELRATTEVIEPDDQRLAVVRERRQALVQLRRKYGDDVAQVLDFLESARRRRDELDAVDVTAAAVRQALVAAEAERDRLAVQIGDARRAAAPKLARAVVDHLGGLALPDAVVEIDVQDGDLAGAGERVELRLAAHPGAPLDGLAKVASGGELSRVMLALRLVLSDGPSAMVFDEVDAGIGGSTAVAVGGALAELNANRQVIVVTHLAQVAAFADQHVRVSKHVADGVTVTTVESLSEDDRVVELSRMLSGTPESSTARDHAVELLASSRGGRVVAERSLR
ncbi:MAG: DNA repair protein RecN, partial [Actinomycetes bacterium]